MQTLTNLLRNTPKNVSMAAFPHDPRHEWGLRMQTETAQPPSLLISINDHRHAQRAGSGKTEKHANSSRSEYGYPYSQRLH